MLGYSAGGLVLRAHFLMVARRCCHYDVGTGDVCGISTSSPPLCTGFEVGDGPVMDGVSRRIHTHPRFSCYIIRTQSICSDGTVCEL